MDFKVQMPGTKAVETLSDGTQQAEFSYDFTLDSKALVQDVDENGDLWVEGYASDFSVDRQDEAFEPGAFERGLKTFLERNPIMLFHHQYDKALGQFVDARVDENGLWVKGRVDAPATGSWAEDVFNKIRKGTIKSFSVGGLFRRRLTPKGPRIYDVDLGEISVTPFPVNPRTTFAVVAQKAFESKSIDEMPLVIEPPAEPVVEGEGEDDGECKECKARAEAEAAAAEEKRVADEALLAGVLERQREDEEAAAAAAAAAEAEAEGKNEPEEAGLTDALLHLTALVTHLEELSKRFEKAEAPEVAAVEQIGS